MQGKLAVIIILALTVLALAAGYVFFFKPSPVDLRFRLNRTPVPDQTGGTMLLPSRVGDFLRQSLDGVKQQPDGSQTGDATYADTDGKKILLQVTRWSGEGNPLSALSTAVATASPAPGTAPVYRADAPFPYSFVTTSNGAAFTWLNGNWVLMASSTEADVETLLQFVNQYDN